MVFITNIQLLMNPLILNFYEIVHGIKIYDYLDY